MNELLFTSRLSKGGFNVREIAFIFRACKAYDSLVDLCTEGAGYIQCRPGCKLLDENGPCSCGASEFHARASLAIQKARG